MTGQEILVLDDLSMTRVRWYVPTINPRRASLRYRCLYPIQELRKRGRSAEIWTAGEPINVSLTLIFDAWTLFPSTSSSDVADEIIAFAHTAKQSGARIILDNCDNQFAGVDTSAEWRRGLERLRHLAHLSDIIVTCSQTLADTMRENVDSSAQFEVIDDPIEERIIYPDDNILKSILSPQRKIAWLRLFKHYIALASDKVVGRTPLVWFGSHGNQFSPGGMCDILSLRPELEHIAKGQQISLTIISNNRKKFEDNFSNWQFPIRYLEWNRVTFLAALRMHKISIIPSVNNAFTQCKSSNRLTLSIHHGLTVIADPIPSYLGYSDVAYIGKWSDNLQRAIADSRSSLENITNYQAKVRARNSIGAIADQWEQLLFHRLVD